MALVNIIAVLVLFFSFIGGLKEGAVKHFFSLITIIVAIFLSGVSFHLLASLFSFLPGENWPNFIGFYTTLSLISLMLYLLFLIPRRFIQLFWKKGAIFRLGGSLLNLLYASIGMVVFALVIEAYPIFGWLAQAVSGSGVLDWLIINLGFIGKMLPVA